MRIEDLIELINQVPANKIYQDTSSDKYKNILVQVHEEILSRYKQKMEALDNFFSVSEEKCLLYTSAILYIMTISSFQETFIDLIKSLFLIYINDSFLDYPDFYKSYIRKLIHDNYGDGKRDDLIFNRTHLDELVTNDFNIFSSLSNEYSNDKSQCSISQFKLKLDKSWRLTCNHYDALRDFLLDKCIFRNKKSTLISITGDGNFKHVYNDFLKKRNEYAHTIPNNIPNRVGIKKEMNTFYKISLEWLDNIQKMIQSKLDE